MSSASRTRWPAPALGALPAFFAIPAGVGDVLIGLTAIGTARSLRAGRVGPAIAWNLLGILDLVVAVGTGVLTAPGPLNLVAVAPDSRTLAALPLVLIPTFVVPLSVVLHVVSLRSLLAGRATVQVPA